MTEIMEPDLKTQIRVEALVNGLVDGKTYKEIAKELGISRSHLHALVRNRPEYRILIQSELELMEEEQEEALKKLENSNSPQDKRTAIVERGKNIRHIRDKLIPTLSANLNITMTAQTEINELRAHQYVIEEALRRISSPARDEFWKQYKQAVEDNDNWVQTNKKGRIIDKPLTQDIDYKIIEP